VIKSVSLLTRRDGMTHAQFVRHWVEVRPARKRDAPFCGIVRAPYD